MKKVILPLICLLIITGLSGCKEEGKNFNRKNGVNDVLEAMMEQERAGEASAELEDEQLPVDESASADDAGATDYYAQQDDPYAEGYDYEDIEALKTGTEGVDVDLSALSGTMAYAEVFHMTVSPEDYIGKTVRMKGLFAQYYDEDADKRYFACIIQDATACCAQGIEFELTGNYVYPDDYPEEGGEICVVGVFDTYEENGERYLTLRNCRKV